VTRWLRGNGAAASTGTFDDDEQFRSLRHDELDHDARANLTED